MKINKLKKHLEGKEIEEIEFEDDGDEEEIKNIRVDYEKLSKYYLLLFNEFDKYFKNYNDKEVQDFILRNRKIIPEILYLRNQLPDANPFNKDFYKTKIRNYVEKNYIEIRDSFDLFVEVFEV